MTRWQERWRLLDDCELASGSHGIVHLVQAIDGNVPRAAMKRPQQRDDGGGGSARLDREAKALRRLREVGVSVPALYECETSSERESYLVCEFIEGQTLSQLAVRNGALPIGVALKISRAISEAIQAAHAVGIFHQDLHASNVMVRHDHSVVLLDWGICALTPDTRRQCFGEVSCKNYRCDDYLALAELHHLMRSGVKATAKAQPSAGDR